MLNHSTRLCMLFVLSVKCTKTPVHLTQPFRRPQREAGAAWHRESHPAQQGHLRGVLHVRQAGRLRRVPLPHKSRAQRQIPRGVLPGEETGHGE